MNSNAKSARKVALLAYFATLLENANIAVLLLIFTGEASTFVGQTLQSSLYIIYFYWKGTSARKAIAYASPPIASLDMLTSSNSFLAGTSLPDWKAIMKEK